MKKYYQTRFTHHASERLKERSLLSEHELAVILDHNKTVVVGNEYPSSRHSLLFFSHIDEKFFVVQQDISDGTVVTVLSIDYWNNLSEKWEGGLTSLSSTWDQSSGCIPWKKKITQKDLKRAVSLSLKPNSSILNHPECKLKDYVEPTSIQLKCGYESLTHHKSLNLGAISVDLLWGEDDSIIEAELRDKIESKLGIKNISKMNLTHISFKLKGESSHSAQPYDCQGKVDTQKLLNALRSYVSENLNKKGSI